MPVQEFVHSITGLISALTLLLGAAASFLVALKKYGQYRESVKRAKATRRTGEDEVEPPLPKRRISLEMASSALAGVLFGIAITILVARFLLPVDSAAGRDAKGPAPTVQITEPTRANDLTVTMDASGSARFDVAGASSGVFGQSGRRIYLLVHPEYPPASGWWIQPDVAVEPSGRWSGVAWIGNKQSRAQPTHRFSLMAVVASQREPVPVDATNVPWLRDPALLEPVATSNFVRAVVSHVVSVPPQ